MNLKLSSLCNSKICGVRERSTYQPFVEENKSNVLNRLNTYSKIFRSEEYGNPQQIKINSL